MRQGFGTFVEIGCTLPIMEIKFQPENKDNTVIKTLTVKARDNYGHEYDIYLLLQRESVGSFPAGPSSLEDKFRFRWVLRIHKTPASWYMSTILFDRKDGSVGFGKQMPERISIDFSQNWYCINFIEVMEEAIQLI